MTCEIEVPVIEIVDVLTDTDMVETNVPTIEIVDVVQKGDKGDAGGIGYIHTQSTPASIWTINHNLGLKPAVQLLSVGGIEFDGEIVHTSINQTIIYLTTAYAGIAQLRI